MSDKQASKRMHRACAGPLLSAAGLSLSLASSAPAATVGPAMHEITLNEEEISDVSLATFFVFDKENPRTPGLQLARGGGGGGGGGCGGCGGHGGCGGCGGAAHAGGGYGGGAHAAGVAHAGAWGGGHMGGGRGGPHTTGPVGPSVSHTWREGHLDHGRFDHGHHFDHEHDHFHNRFVRNRFFFAGGWWPYYYDYGYNCWWLRRKAVITGSPYWWRRYNYCVGYY